MSEHDDELASAYLDDAATAEERARVEADPTLVERVEALRRVRDVVASTPVPAPIAEVRDAAIGAAMGEPNVVDLRVARVRRRLRVASIAAAIVLVVGVAGLLARSLNTGGSRSAKTAAGASSPSSTAGASSSERNAAAGATPFAASGQSAALGSFTDRPSLAAAAKAALSASLSTSAGADRASPGGAPTPPSCATPAPDHSVTRALAGTAVLQGEPVQVDVFTLADGSQELVVTYVGSCTTVFTQRL